LIVFPSYTINIPLKADIVNTFDTIFAIFLKIIGMIFDSINAILYGVNFWRYKSMTYSDLLNKILKI
jgi:hypothetical protein